MNNFVCRLILSQFFIYCPWFSRNNSISGATSIKALRKESLGRFPIEIETKISKLITYSYSLAICNKLAYQCFNFDRKSTYLILVLISIGKLPTICYRLTTLAICITDEEEIVNIDLVPILQKIGAKNCIVSQMSLKKVD